MAGADRRGGRWRAPIRPVNEQARKLAEVLRAHVDRSGKTLAVLSKEIDLSTSQISTYLGGRIPPPEFVARLVAATVDPPLRERRQSEAAALLDQAEHPPRATARTGLPGTGAPGSVELVTAMAQHIETYDRLTHAMEQQAQLRQAADNYARLCWMLLGIIQWLEARGDLLGQERDRLPETAGREVQTELEARLARTQAQQATADSELARAEARRLRAEELATLLQKQIVALNHELDRLRGNDPHPDGFPLDRSLAASPRLGPESSSVDLQADDIDAVLVRVATVSDTDGDTVDRITREVGEGAPGRIGRTERSDDVPPIQEDPDENRFTLLGVFGKDEVVQKLSRVLQIDPDDVVALTGRGLRYHKGRQYDQALADLNHALRVEPDSATALFHRAGVLNRTDRHEEALADLDRVHRLRPANAFVLARRGDTHLALKRLPAALADFTHALALAPGDLSIRTRRGDANSRSNRFLEALDDFTHVIEAAPENFHALIKRGAVHTDLERFDEALLDFDRALALKPGYHEALLLRAYLHARAHRYQEALADLDLMTAIDSFLAALVLRAEIHSRLGRFEDALSDADQVLDRGTPELRVLSLCTRASVLLQYDRLDDALADLERALKMDPNCADAYSSRGTAYQSQGFFEKALADHDRAVAIAPRSPEALIHRGETYLLMGRFMAALEDFDRALAIDALHPDALAGRKRAESARAL
ncbi:tetratricopeptide repeat protein [Streptomyces sp. NPDC059917]|uniref:tetratricopeptide repeat protein n=1 Tax=Streptomyces sp. NPDC059917 TaxID=3347002 RepID=UPI003660B444